jgi:hypothetical protein
VLDTLQIGDTDLQEDETPIDLDNGGVVLDCLRPDWDILIEIQSVLQSLVHVRLQYVEGHQDRKRPYPSLNLLGQLNVDADQQAGQYNLECGAQQPIVLLSPLAKAHLILADGTDTGSSTGKLMRQLSIALQYPIPTWSNSCIDYYPLQLRRINSTAGIEGARCAVLLTRIIFTSSDVSTVLVANGGLSSWLDSEIPLFTRTHHQCCVN